MDKIVGHTKLFNLGMANDLGEKIRNSKHL